MSMMPPKTHLFCRTFSYRNVPKDHLPLAGGLKDNFDNDLQAALRLRTNLNLTSVLILITQLLKYLLKYRTEFCKYNEYTYVAPGAR